MTKYDPLPTYISHKRVRALEIASIGAYDPMNDRRLVSFSDARFSPVKMEERMFSRYKPGPGDFYVVYEDGYQSFSPRKAFLEGYTPEGDIIRHEQSEVERLRTILRQCVRGPDLVELGNGERLWLHLPYKDGVATFKQEPKP